MGTRLAQGLQLEIMNKASKVILCLDDDAAGWAGTASITRQLKPFLPVYDRHFNCDPKAATVKQILGALNNV